MREPSLATGWRTRPSALTWQKWHRPSPSLSMLEWGLNRAASNRRWNTTQRDIMWMRLSVSSKSLIIAIVGKFKRCLKRSKVDRVTESCHKDFWPALGHQQVWMTMAGTGRKVESLNKGFGVERRVELGVAPHICNPSPWEDSQANCHGFKASLATELNPVSKNQIKSPTTRRKVKQSERKF